MSILFNTFLFLGLVLGSVLLTVACYAGSRWLFRNKLDELRDDFASSIVFRIAALHALIIALVFAQEMLDYNSVRQTISDEAVAVGDVFFDLGRYDPEKTLALRQSLADYAHAVVHEEWEQLGRGDGLSAAAWRHWETTYQGILDLEVLDNREEMLVAQMLLKVRQISGQRRARSNTAGYGLNPLFWIIAIVGLSLVAVSYMAFPPTFLTVTLLSMFAAYTGLVMFAVAAIDNPFTEPGKLQPVGMNELLVSEMENFFTGK